MNNVIELKNKQLLYEDLAKDKRPFGSFHIFVADFLTSLGIYSFEDITVQTFFEYIYHCRKAFINQNNHYIIYKTELEVFYYSYQKYLSHPLTMVSSSYAEYRKCASFLMVSGIRSPKEITPMIRCSFEEYLNISSSPSIVNNYMKILDKLKLSSIKKLTAVSHPPYKNEPLFLPYYPDYKVARAFYYSQNKNELLFDFSLRIPEQLKKQIYSGVLDLINDVKSGNTQDLRFLYITPLYHLYHFCIKEHIYNIKMLMHRDVLAFSEYLQEKGFQKPNYRLMLITRMRRLLFLSDERTDFDATVWYTERFHLTETRINASCPITAFYFDDIYNSENRHLLQQFIRYLLTLSPKYALLGIQKDYMYIREWLLFLEKKGISVASVKKEDLKEYLEMKEPYLKDTSFNRILAVLDFFFRVLKIRENIELPDFHLSEYHKKTVIAHIDRSVADEDIDAILSILYQFPEKLGLMFLTLYCTGLRMGEVCSLKKNAPLTFDGEYYLSVYQSKTKSEKRIPIPKSLYDLLVRFAKQEPDSEYMFPSVFHTDRPYHVSTFSKQMKAQLRLYGVTESINFRSHDFRHTIATDLHLSGASIGVTRAFLGHEREDMTVHYIDHLPGEIDRLQKNYFKERQL